VLEKEGEGSTSYGDEEDLGDPDSTMISHSHGVREREREREREISAPCVKTLRSYMLSQGRKEERKKAILPRRRSFWLNFFLTAHTTTNNLSRWIIQA